MRVVLETLGVEDYGIYNVAAGVVAMFGFISDSMAIATQRFLSFELGRNDLKKLNMIFNISLIVYACIVLMVIILAETIGLWFVNHKLAIPQGRNNAAQWIYQFAVFSFAFTLIAVPYIAVILAHEDMQIYAVLSIVKAILELGMVLLLQYIYWDKLKLYGLFLCVISAIHCVVYMTVSKLKYKECQFKFVWDKTVLYEMANYNGWIVFESFIYLFVSHIPKFFLNQFFNPAMAGVYSLARQINSAAATFFLGFSQSLRPPIIKSYAANKNKELLFLIFSGSKGNFFLLYLFVLPVMLELPMLLSLWLKDVPEYVVLFTRLLLIDTMIDSINYPIKTAMLASPKIGLFELVVHGIWFLYLPLIWISLSLGAPAVIVIILQIILRFLSSLSIFIIINRYFVFPVLVFFKEVLVCVCLVMVISAIFPVLVFYHVPEGFFRLFLVTGISIVSVCGSMYLLGMNNDERNYLKKTVINKLSY